MKIYGDTNSGIASSEMGLRPARAALCWIDIDTNEATVAHDGVLKTQQRRPGSNRQLEDGRTLAQSTPSSAISPRAAISSGGRLFAQAKME